MYEIIIQEPQVGTISKKVASLIKQNVDTVAVKYICHCDCQVVQDNHSGSNCRLLVKKKLASMRHLPKQQVGTKCNGIYSSVQTIACCGQPITQANTKQTSGFLL